MKKGCLVQLVIGLVFIGGCISIFSLHDKQLTSWKKNVRLQKVSEAQVRTCYVEEKITQMMRTTDEPVSGKAIEQLREMAKELFPDGEYYSGYKKPMQRALQINGHKIIYTDDHEAFYVKLGN